MPAIAGHSGTALEKSGREAKPRIQQLRNLPCADFLFAYYQLKQYIVPPKKSFGSHPNLCWCHALGATMDIADRIVQRLHPSAYLHFDRAKTFLANRSSNRVDSAVRLRRQQLHQAFCSQQDDDTILEVVRRLHEFVSRKKELRRAVQINRDTKERENLLLNSCTLSVPSSMEESENLGDTSDASIINLAP